LTDFSSQAEFQDSIIEDLRLMDIHGDKISYSSDYFTQLHELAIKLIKLGKAYADDTLQEKVLYILSGMFTAPR
jgi:glutamyl-tRNA synthetase